MFVSVFDLDLKEIYFKVKFVISQVDSLSRYFNVSKRKPSSLHYVDFLSFCSFL